MFLGILVDEDTDMNRLFIIRLLTFLPLVNNGTAAADSNVPPPL